MNYSTLNFSLLRLNRAGRHRKLAIIKPRARVDLKAHRAD